MVLQNALQSIQRIYMYIIVMMVLLQVSLGNYAYHPGYMQYQAASKLPLILGLVFGLALPILVAILIIIICLRRQAKKTKPKHMMVPVPDGPMSYSDLRTGSRQDNSTLQDLPEERMPLKVDVHSGADEESPQDTTALIPGDSYIQRLLKRIENEKLRQEVAEVVIGQNRLELGEELGKGRRRLWWEEPRKVADCGMEN